MGENLRDKTLLRGWPGHITRAVSAQSGTIPGPQEFHGGGVTIRAGVCMQPLASEALPGSRALCALGQGAFPESECQGGEVTHSLGERPSCPTVTQLEGLGMLCTC